MFTGLSAFPITPFKKERIDIAALETLIQNLIDAAVDSICVMGSTGLYPYLSLQEKRQVLNTTVSLANDIPVFAGIGALRLTDVLRNAELAQQAGASAVLLAPVSYHPLRESEVLSLYTEVCRHISVPLCVYENPGVTQFTFSNDLYKTITRLPHVAAIKVPGMPFSTPDGPAHLATLRSLVPESVAIGVSGDKFGAAGMAAGCDLWLSVLGGLFPKTVQTLLRNPVSLDDGRFDDLWALFNNSKGGMRVMATAAELLGYAEQSCLPAPLCSLQGAERAQLAALLTQLDLQ